MEVGNRQLLTTSELNEGELELIKSAQTGIWWQAPRDQSFGPRVSSLEMETVKHAIRAQVLYQLLTGHGELSKANGEVVAVRAVRILGAKIIGQLDLRNVNSRCLLELVACEFAEKSGPLLLSGASFPGLTLHSCMARGVSAFNLAVRGNLDLRYIRGVDSIDLRSAHVAGSLLMNGARIGAGSPVSLDASSSEVRGSVVLTGKFHAVGTVSFMNSSIGSHLEMDGADLRCAGGLAVLAEGLRIEGSVFARSNFTAVGKMQFVNAKIGGSITLDSATVLNDGGDAIDFSSANIRGDLLARSGFEASGSVKLVGAEIGGSVLLSGGRIDNAGSRSLHADRATIKGGILARSDFTSNGVISLIEASLGGELSFDGAQLRNPGDAALRAHRVSIGGAIFMRSAASIEGSLQLDGASVDGQVVMHQCEINCPDGIAVSFARASLNGGLVFQPGSLVGAVDLRAATTTEYSDNEVGRRVRFYISQFVYEKFRPGIHMTSINERLDWIGSDPDGYGPTPYSQLADVLRREGHFSEAKFVLLRCQQVKWSRSTGVRGLAEKAWSALLRLTIGYGYRPWRAVGWLSLIILSGSILFDRIPRESFREATGAPPFNALLYTLDNLLPFVDLGYSKWVPQGLAHAATSTVVLLGWAFVTALVAAFAGVLRRGD